MLVINPVLNMSLLDGALVRHRAVCEQIAYPQFSHRGHYCGRRWGFCAKVKADGDAEQGNQLSQKGFSIQVPTIPKIGDMESARRLLESAFQSLSFGIPKMQIYSALHGLPFAIPKLSMPMRVLVLDIPGFVAARLKKRQKRDLEDVHVDEALYPRCAWPRTVKGMHVDDYGRIASVENLQEEETYHQNLQEEETYHQNLVAPHCTWPRATGHLAYATEASSISSNAPSPQCTWPRGTMSSQGGALASEQKSKAQFMEKEKILPSVVEGGARCAWPRKSVPAGPNFYSMGKADNGENLEAFEVTSELSDGQAQPPQVEEVAELPRRLLATSVGLTVMNHLAKGSIATSVFDLSSSLPAGSLGLSDEEGAVMDVGRRTLLVFIKGSIGLA